MGRWLVPYEVRAIRRLRREGWEVQQIAELFGISRASISATCNGHRYSHIPDDIPTEPHAFDSMSLFSIRRALQAREQGAVQLR